MRKDVRREMLHERKKKRAKKGEAVYLRVYALGKDVEKLNLYGTSRVW